MTPLHKRLWIYGSLLAFLAMAWAILAPIFAAARPKSRDVTCLSNLKQLALGVEMYAQDCGETVPPARTWGAATYPYVKSRSLFRCPLASWPYGYAFSDAMDKVILGSLAAPAETVLLLEADGLRLDTHGGPDRVTHEDRHHGTLNWAFADGHVRGSPRGSAVRWKP